MYKNIWTSEKENKVIGFGDGFIVMRPLEGIVDRPEPPIGQGFLFDSNDICRDCITNKSLKI